MARIRTIKPEFFISEALSGCSPHARLLAIAVLQLADCAGRFRVVPMQLHAHAFPYEQINVLSLLGELEEIDYLRTYKSAGNTYAWIVKFVEHQRLTGREAAEQSRLPEWPGDDPGGAEETPRKHMGNTEETPGKHPGSITEAPGKHPGSGVSCPERERERERERDGTSLRSVPPAGSASAADTLESAFEAIWLAYPKRAGGNPRRRAQQAYTARVRSGQHEHAEILAGVERYAAYCAATGRVGTEFVMQAATFLGPDARFTETWEVTDGARRNGSGARARALSATERVDRANGGPGYDADDAGDAPHGGAVEADGPGVRPSLGGKLRRDG